jgi:hypothetical protein
MFIRSKARFFELWEAGVLGNRTRLWRDPEEACDFGRKNRVGIGFREIRPAGTSGAGWWERVHWSETIKTAEKWKQAGKVFIMDDGCPDDKRILQGEVCRTYRGLEGWLDQISKLPMRPAMAAGHMKYTSPLQTLMLLQRHMDPSSLEDLWALLDLYPDAAIEFSTFTTNVGVFPGRNTLFWETRNY